MYEARQNKEKVNHTIPFQIRKPTQHFTLQREVPRQKGMVPHPTPETGLYHARPDSHIFTKKDYPRSKFQFGKYTRDEVLSRFPHVFIGNRIVAVQDSVTKQMTNVEGIQLDHEFSWDNIADIMDADGNYNVHEARNYYNDQSNLHPVFGNLNASAGAAGIPLDLRSVDININERLANIQVKWMNMQNYINAIERNFASEGAIFDYLDNIENAIDGFMNKELGEDVDMGILKKRKRLS